MTVIIPIQARRYDLELLKPGFAEGFSVTKNVFVSSAARLTSNVRIGCVVALVRLGRAPFMCKKGLSEIFILYMFQDR